MNISPIHSEQDYENALARIEEIFESKPGTREGDELELLGILVEEYEKKHFPIDAPKPIEAIKFRMEQLGMGQKDFAKLIGSRSRASEILAGKRNLSLKQIQIIHRNLGIPAEILISEPELVV